MILHVSRFQAASARLSPFADMACARQVDILLRQRGAEKAKLSKFVDSDCSHEPRDQGHSKD